MWGVEMDILLNYLSEVGYQIEGMDIAEDGIRIAKETYPHLRFTLHSVYEELADLPGVPADVIILSEVIEHLYYPRLCLRNIYSALRPEWIL